MIKQAEIKTVTVVGANGTMGTNVSAIFASFGKAKVYMISRSIEKSQFAKEKAVCSVRAESIKHKLIPADYTMLEQCVLESDLIFESTSEDWNVKSVVTKQIVEIAERQMDCCSHKVFCTGTSGLSITKLSKLYPPKLRGNYMGIHMFNPPYVMTLCELIPGQYTDRKVFNFIKYYCENVLYRTTVEVKDSPAFLGNRIGFQFINEALQFAEIYKDNGGIDYIDSILGPFTGRNMAPCVTANFVGLDVHEAIVKNLYQNTNDFAHDTFKSPTFVIRLLIEGKLGKKSGEGLYKTTQHESGIKIHQVYDIKTGIYRNVINYTFPFVEAMLEKIKEGDYDNAFQIVENNHSLEAEICCYFLLKYVLYSLEATRLVGYDICSADDVMATGFGWCPPLALIEALGGMERFRKLCEKKIADEILLEVNFEQLIENIAPSQYDFRRFIRAKR